MCEDDMGIWLENLHAVLRVPSDDRSPVEIFHKSFADFLFGGGEDLRIGGESLRMNPCKISASDARRVLQTRCIDQMTKAPGSLQKKHLQAQRPRYSGQRYP